MRTRRTKMISTSALILALLLAVSLAAGCGGASVNAQSLLNQSGQKMSDVTSAKMRMEMSGSAATQSMMGNFDIEEAKTADGFQMKMSGEVAGQPVVMYMIGGTIYMNIMGQWMKTSMAELGTTGSQIGMGSLDDMQKMLTGAQGAKAVSEDTTSTTVNFKLGPDYIKQQMSGLSKSVDSSVLGNTNLDVTVKINKADNQVSEMTEKLKASGGSLGSVDTTVKMTLVGYNVPVNTQPPPEALNASGMTLPGLSPSQGLTPGL